MRFTIVVHKVSNVPKMDTFGHADPYVKVSAGIDQMLVPVLRTKTVKNCANAEFGESGDIAPTATTIKMVLMDADTVSDEVIGEAVISAPFETVQQVTVALTGKECSSGKCTITYSLAVEGGGGGAGASQVRASGKRSEKLQRAVFQHGLSATVGISWDNKVDVDLVCVALDCTGLILDACFFNNMTALGGALRHGGDRRDGTATSIDETITVATSLLPPQTFALLFCLQCADPADFSSCGAAALHWIQPADGGRQPPAFPPPVSLTQFLGNATFACACTMRRASMSEWVLEAEVCSLPAPTRSFMAAFQSLLSMVDVDPTMARELQNAQPTFSLKKGEAQTIPVGLAKVDFGLGWDSRCDVDSSCIGLKRGGELAFTVFFGNKSWKDVVVHSGDNTTGVGKGDDETIKVDLMAMPMDVVSIFFTVNVYSASSTFCDVKGEYCRLVDVSRGRPPRELMRFASLDSGAFNGIVMVALHRQPHFPEQWKFVAVSYPAQGRTCKDLIDECQQLQADYHADGGTGQQVSL